MTDFRLLTPPSHEWLVVPAYRCRTREREQRILSLAPRRDVAALRMAEDGTDASIVSDPDPERRIDASSNMNGQSSTWRRTFRLPHHGTLSGATLLLRAGKGRFQPRLGIEAASHIPRWMHPFVMHPLDSFAVWERWGDPRLLASAAARLPSSADTPAQLDFLMGDAARGVVYSRSYAYDLANGEPSGVTIRLLTIAARISFYELSRSPAFYADVSRYCTTVPLADDGSFKEPSPLPVEAPWLALIAKARVGFSRQCAIEPAGCAARRAYLIEQMDKEDDDDQLNGSSFRSSVMRLDWQHALARVTEAWQLSIVADVFADVFADRRGRRTFRRAVETMLREHACPEDRRSELLHMSREYLALAYDDWNMPLVRRPPSS